MTLFNPGRSAFDQDETRSIRAVYVLAISALGHTHQVDQQTARHLANAVFEAYVSSGWPATPMSSNQIEEMALLSIQLMLDSHPGQLVLKH